MSELPFDWRMVDLCEVLQVLPSGKKLQMGWSPQCLTTPRDSETDWAVLKTSAIQSGEYRPEEHKALPDNLEPRSSIEVQTGDLLLTNAGPRSRCGIPCLVRQTPARLMMSGKMYRFRTEPEVMDARFLEYYLLSQSAQSQIEPMKTGISESGLNLTHSRFLGLQVPLPPLVEQRRIVAILEDHLSHLDAGMASLSRAQLLQEVARRVSLVNSLAAVREFATRRLDDVAETRLGKMLDAKKTIGTPTSYLRNRNVQWRRIDFADLKKVPLDSNEVHEFSLRSGDLLICEGGEPGRCAVIDNTPTGPLAFQKALHRVRVSEVLLPHFLQMTLEAMSMAGDLDTLFTGTTIRHLPQEKLRAMAIPVPDLKAQHIFVDAHQEFLTAMRLTSKSVCAAELRGHAMRQSLLSSAFSGQLTGVTHV
jgi:type I restriction enzyme S subunit